MPDAEDRPDVAHLEGWAEGRTLGGDAGVQLVERRPIGELQQAIDEGVEVAVAEQVCAPEIRDVALLRATRVLVAIGVDDLEVGPRAGSGDLQLHAMTLRHSSSSCQTLQNATSAITQVS